MSLPAALTQLKPPSKLKVPNESESNGATSSSPGRKSPTFLLVVIFTDGKDSVTIPVSHPIISQTYGPGPSCPTPTKALAGDYRPPLARSSSTQSPSSAGASPVIRDRVSTRPRDTSLGAQWSDKRIEPSVRRSNCKELITKKWSDDVGYERRMSALFLGDWFFLMPDVLWRRRRNLLSSNASASTAQKLRVPGLF